MRYARSLPALAAVVSTGCAATPDVTYHYYLPKAATVVTITESVDCSADGQKLFFVLDGSQTTTYIRDPGRGQTFAVKDLSSQFANTTLTFNLTDDGRLKSINASSTGQGETIIKGAVTLAASVAAAVDNTPSPPCKVVKDWGGGKPVSLVFKAAVDFSDPHHGTEVEIAPAPDSDLLFKKLQSTGPHLPPLTLHVGPPMAVEPGATPGEAKDVAFLTLNRTAVVALNVTARQAGKDEPVWSGTINVPTQDYRLPIPKGALFGNQTFALTLNDSGAITTITYNADSGAAAAQNAANSIAQALKQDTLADKTSALKEQSDYIVQQQRAVRCKANPAGCT